MRLTWIRQRFGRDALCEHHAADVDQVPIWRGALCDQQHVADVDRATVGQRFGTVRILLNSMPCHRKTIQSISRSFDAVVHPSA